MTNAELIAKIKAEIERLMACVGKASCELKDFTPYMDGELTAYEDILSFLDTLEESENTYDTQQCTPRPSVGIEDVARVQFASHAKVFNKKRKAVFDWNQFKEVAGIFYGFGRKDTLDSGKPMNQDELEEELDKWRHIHFHGKRDGYFAGEYFERSSQLDIARHFAKWGAEHLKK